MKTIIFDLDGTLADLSHRLHFAKAKQWDEFFKHVKGDIPIVKNIEIYHTFSDALEQHSDGHWANPKYEIGILSGRSEVCREDTVEWLRVNDIPFDFLHMRPANDRRPDYVVKKALYDTYLRDKDILCFFDDRNQVVNLWRSLGHTCFQVAEGNF